MADPGRPPRTPAPSTTERRRSLTNAWSRPVTVIASLDDALCYEADDATARFTRDGDLAPSKSRRKTFGKGLHRLRDRLRHLDERLQLDINGLKQEVINLQLHKSLMETKMQAQWTRQTDAAVACVREYFGSFEFGWLEVVRIAGQPRVVSSWTDRPWQVELADRQRHFVASALHPEMKYGNFHDGVQVLVDQWRFYSSSYQQLRLTLNEISCTTATGLPVVTAFGTVGGVLTEHALRLLYPHLARGDVVFEQLVGSQVVFACRITCYLDTSMRILRIDHDVDRVGGLQKLLLNPVDVTYALSSALVPEDRVWGFRDDDVVDV